MAPSFFKANRARLMGDLGEGVVVLTAFTRMQLTNDSAAPFEQESNFWWLTGLIKPDWLLLLDAGQHKSWLIYPDLSETQRVFDGVIDAKEAQAISGVDEVVSRAEGMSLLRTLGKLYPLVHTLGPSPASRAAEFAVNPAPRRLRARLTRIFDSLHDIRGVLTRLRRIKQPKEVAALQKAIDITVTAFSHIRRTIDQYGSEYEIEAELSAQFRRVGSKGHAFAPIVAGGKRACTLHYDRNSEQLEAVGLVLIDAGARHIYPADITRTYACGTPTQRQREVHATVREALEQISALLRPGLATKDYLKQADDVMKKAMHQLGLLPDVTDAAVFRRYFPHTISHGLGVDVHDSLGQPEYFEPGMVLTVEPGIYIPEEAIGVRLEDDVLITAGGHCVLNGSLSTEL